MSEATTNSTYFTKILDAAIKLDASDIHLTEGDVPRVRVQGVLKKLDSPTVSADDMSAAFNAISDTLEKDLGAVVDKL